MDEDVQSATPVLDAGQLVRIESVHRGFLYQHLYAVGCLLRAQQSGVTAVLVERDEDIEVVWPDRRIYVQVKSRSKPLTWADIESVLQRFDGIRKEHRSGARTGTAQFVIATNATPGPQLTGRMTAQDWPIDVCVHWPAMDREIDAALPLPQADVTGALADSAGIAAQLPFARLAPETLVWKLAGAVTGASAGNPPRIDHAFRVNELLALFEQLVVQLHDIPAPPVTYRAHADEPALQSAERVRIITGWSGAGKTAWLAQAAVHAQGHVIYFDVTETPGPTVASSVAREVAARLFGKKGGVLGEVLLPGATGSEILQLIGKRIAETGDDVMIVIDNAHRIPPGDLVQLVQNGAAFGFVLLCQPDRNVAELESVLRLRAERLRGWSTDTIAREASMRGAHGDYVAFARLGDVTGGMPLYVQNAIGIAASEYDGDIRRLCDDLDAQTHGVETAQELILRRVFENYSENERRAVGVLSFCEVALDQTDMVAAVGAALNFSDRQAIGALRQLRSRGCVEIFGAGRTKIHDSIRVLGRGYLAECGSDLVDAAQVALRDAVKVSLLREWDVAKVRLYLRLLAATGDVNTLSQLASDELFHEMGFLSEILEFLDEAATSEDNAPHDRFWALDGLVLSEMKSGVYEAASRRIAQMDLLIAEHNLGAQERLAAAMKRMNMLGVQGNIEKLLASIDDIEEFLPDTRAHQRVFRYNAAHALFSAGRPDVATSITGPLIEEYYDVLGLEPADVMGRNPDKIGPLLKKSVDQVDHLKHLADTLDLHATAMKASGRASPMGRIHAMKFYNLAGAYDSLVRVGQALVDDFVERNDFIGAREIIEGHLLPCVDKLKLLERVIPVRSQYAVILAYSGAFDAADAEMGRLAPYEAGLTTEGQQELRNQRKLVGELRRRGPPPQLILPSLNRMALPVAKVGRNEPCPCGSGKKYKKCHG